MFFPHLYKKGQSRAIPTETRKFIYESCIRPAVLAVYPVDTSRWPLNYEVAMTLCRDDKGLFHFGSIDLPPHLLAHFGDQLLQRFDQHESFRDAFFLHELRGTKSASHHDPGNPEERRRALDCVLHILDQSKLKQDDWLVDIGMEVRHPGHILQWLVKDHRQVLRFLLPSASIEQTNAVLASKTQYHCDLSAQLTDLGGFRAEPSSRGSKDHVSYINVYSTDKSGTYQLHQGLFKLRKAWHLFPGKIERLVKDLERMCDVFRTYGDNSGSGLEGNARMEIRVPMGLADKVLLNPPDDFIQRVIATFDCPTLW
jgi:hypothetical protein